MPRPNLAAEPDEEAQINLSPMIDCIFILLIFFIVTTVFIEEPGVEVFKPDATVDADLEKNSIIIALTTAVLSTLLGIMAARASARYKFPAQKAIMGFIMLPLVLPEIIVGVSLLVVILQLGFQLSLWSIILGHVLICTPFCVAILTSAFLNLDQSLEEASFDLGWSRFQTFWRITMPLVAPGIISSMLIAFTISLDEFIIAFFLAGTEPTLPVYIWGQLRFPARLPSLMALGTILLVVSLTLLLIAEYFRRRTARKTGTEDAGGFL